MATLRQEVWVKQLMEGYYPDSSFLNYCRDFSGLVNNDAVTIAEAGIDPDVLIDNSTYPITVVKRDDKPYRIELSLFETENTLVREPEVIEYSYDQLESVLMGHRNALRAKTAEKAAHAIAPQKDSEFTPVIATTGEVVAGRKRLTFADVLALKERFDNANIPLERRYLVLNPSHVSDLILSDLKTFKDITDVVDGQPKRFAGFGILQTSVTPRYNAKTLEKIAFDAEKADTDTFSSFAFVTDEVFKADGEAKMYANMHDPKERATIIGFDKRFICVPIRNRGIASIVSAKV